MPKYICKCGNLINLSDIPSPNQLLMIEDVDYDKFFEKIDAEELYDEMMLVVRCDTCKRLYVFESGFDEEPIMYKIEEGVWNKRI
ncbi:hypothetical protein [Flavobacterium branchiophilum]|uniref:Uncharacterized protein n=1 Tax=Flavobacterium branchiophilum TaxID=55197 RepID=A0A2H3KUN5_9FLAO|nr:hypothetical protein [Flavobacterium branchiophilum]PDS23997.1 hypothetical protein B0A77_09465 [Flavobacterium branchiophilum]